MRKDYVETRGDTADETSFVERYWTKVWEREGGPKGRIEKVPRREEYKLMAPYLEDMPPGAEILDGGCGLGDWVLYLQRRGFKTTGLDLSREVIEQLKTRFPEAEFSAGDIRETGFADNRFDAYFSWGVFEHFEAGPQACIREALRILKPGGLLFMSTPFDNFRHALRASLTRPKQEVQQARFYQYRFTRAELARELALGGFDVLSVRPIHKRQGALRSLQHEFGLPYEWLLTRGMSAVLAPFLPGGVIAHMVMAIARKPERPAS